MAATQESDADLEACALCHQHPFAFCVRTYKKANIGMSPVIRFFSVLKLHRRDCLALEESFVVVLVVYLLLRVVLLA